MFLFSCENNVLPKPKAMLRLDYPNATYENFSTGCSYKFDKNVDAKIVTKDNCSYDIDYLKMKASIFITYKPIHNNFTELVQDAQKLTYEHVVKADNIVEQKYENIDDKVYGMFYKVIGNAASQAQFYVTDSTNHFLTGSLYFYAKPNYDSIIPAASYLENDIMKIMESLKWKD